VKSRGWHIQLDATLPAIVATKDALAASPMTPLDLVHQPGPAAGLAARVGNAEVQ
jgi:hypothetical protein